MTGLDAGSESSPSMEPLLNALSVETNRMILSALDEPMTAAELVEECEISSSTVYRKLDMLGKVGLVTEHLAVDPRSGRFSLYERNVERVSVSIGDDGRLTVRVERPTESSDEETTWGAVES